MLTYNVSTRDSVRYAPTPSPSPQVGGHITLLMIIVIIQFYHQIKAKQNIWQVHPPPPHLLPRWQLYQMTLSLRYLLSQIQNNNWMLMQRLNLLCLIIFLNKRVFDYYYYCFILKNIQKFLTFTKERNTSHSASHRSGTINDITWGAILNR